MPDLFSNCGKTKPYTKVPDLSTFPGQPKQHQLPNIALFTLGGCDAVGRTLTALLRVPVPDL